MSYSEVFGRTADRSTAGSCTAGAASPVAGGAGARGAPRGAQGERRVVVRLGGLVVQVLLQVEVLEELQLP